MSQHYGIANGVSNSNSNNNRRDCRMNEISREEDEIYADEFDVSDSDDIKHQHHQHH